VLDVVAALYPLTWWKEELLREVRDADGWVHEVSSWVKRRERSPPQSDHAEFFEDPCGDAGG
jgi:hypothetical protein